ncbi:hypothetical protein [Pseudonocardia broussonetiae]|uniref:Uncharacterized protein n=1 Tax=Pseudonocardia broussonetiae TaxID=2736640 RepID=A0A6M6JT22_9PSEU|nr:hypothetical protein [Pseudonocardia broussonetiae]QJY51254.1 hypothetical protein HOP40_35325 [Pseudonocardia broussonetiae]
MATVSTQNLALDGAAPVYSAASPGGDRFTPSRNTFLHVVNASASPVTATLTTPGNVDGLAIPERGVTVPAGANRMVPLPPGTYRSADGLADVAWSATTSVTFAVLHAV